MRFRSVKATVEEHDRQLPGDDVIPNAVAQLTHAITIHASRREIWPWLVQMGAGARAGWYSYDRLDNGGYPSATRVLPYLQQIKTGTLMPALPGRTDGFHVLQFEPGSSLVLEWRSVEGPPLTTWAFVLDDLACGSVRLIVRSRANPAYPFFNMPRAIGEPIVRAVHFIMQRKQLVGVAARAESYDSLLDRFMPEFDIRERHEVRVAASAVRTLDAARHLDFQSSTLVRAIFKLRALAMRGRATEPDRPRGLLAETESMGWRILAEIPGREIVVGAAARPWLADVTFEPIAADQFATFDRADFVKIAWTLRADRLSPETTVFSTETRAIATDGAARAKFRRYWRRVRLGVIAIRWLMLHRVKREAEANRLESLAHGRSH